jgi:hypothetical protein
MFAKKSTTSSPHHTTKMEAQAAIAPEQKERQEEPSVEKNAMEHATANEKQKAVHMDLDELMRRLKVMGLGEFLPHVLLVLNWGSRVYGTHRPESDYDFAVVLEQATAVDWERFDCTFSEEIYFDDGHVNGTMCRWNKFEAKLREHRLETLELIFLPPAHVWLQRCELPVVQLDHAVLRRTLFYEVHHSLQKGRRHLFEDNLPRKMKKEIFHALRYVLFTEQLLDHGRIVGTASVTVVLEGWTGSGGGEGVV